MAITPIGTPGLFTPPTILPSTPDSADQPFADTLTRMVDKVAQSGAAANDAIGRMLDGSGDVHEAMIAIQSADTTFQLAVQVRNKLVTAYQEIMRMPV
jgi:flagellar hook-basal body complex protein FliE